MHFLKGSTTCCMISIFSKSEIFPQPSALAREKSWQKGKGYEARGKFSSVQFSRSTCLTLCDPWIAAWQASLSITNTWSLPKSMSIESVMPSNHLILCRPFFCPQSFPASGSFQMSHLFAAGGQRIGVSASTSVLPMNTQD